MTLIISNENVQEALDHGDLDLQQILGGVEGAYRDLAAGKAAYAPRRGVKVPLPEERRHPGFLNEHFLFAVMEGAIETTGYFAIRLKPDMRYGLEDPATGTKTTEKYAVEPGRYCGLILLFSTTNAEPLAILNDGILQHLRVAASAALAARHMAREDARVLGIFGSGGMAHSHAALLARVRPLERIKVYSPTRGHRELFASEMAEQLGIPVEPVDSAALLPDGCDMIACCTDSTVPVMLPEFVRPGTFYCNVVGEIDGRAADRIDAVVLHQSASMPTGATYATSEGRIGPDGAIEPILNEGTDRPFTRGPKVRGTLAQLITGRIPGRERADETNYFNNNAGTGIQFAAIAGQVYEVMKKRGGAREIPTDWLMQSIRN